MSKVDIHDPAESLVEKIMAHFGWYKVMKVELPVENLEINHVFTMKPLETKSVQFPDFPVKRPTVKKPTPRKKSNAK